MIKIEKKEVLHISLLFLILVFGILGISGTLTSGIHLVDDHEFWDFSYMLNNGMSFKEVVTQKMKGDFSWRFRPLYYPLRVLQAGIIGPNLLLLSIFKGIEVVISCSLIYFIARKLKCDKYVSVCATLFMLVGPQSATWWKLGPQELTGTWIFAVGILGVILWKETKLKRYNVMAILSFFIVSLYKESFIALIPAVMLMYLYFSLDGKDITWKNLWEAIKDNLFSEIILGLILVVEAFVILFVIGTNEMQYIGVGANTPIWDYVKVFLNNFRLHLRIGQYGFFVLGVLCIIGKELSGVFHKLKWHILLACAMVLPQFVLYAKSGLEERYIIPWIFGVGYLFVIVLARDNVLSRKKKYFYNILLIILFIANFLLVFYEATYFTYRGKGVTKMYEVTSEIAVEDTKVMTAFHPYEESYHSTVEILRTEGIESVYLEYNGAISKWYGIDPVTFEEIDIILMYNEKDRHYLFEQNLDLSEFEVVDYNTVSVAVRKNGKEYKNFISLDME